MADGLVGRHRRWDDRKRGYLESVTRLIGVPLELEGRASSRWARCPAGVIAVLASRRHARQNWWFGLQEKDFQDRVPLGVILLCDSDDALLDFCIPALRIQELLPDLSRSGDQREFNLFRRGHRYVLQVPGRGDVDVTAARGDLSWLGTATASSVREQPAEGPASTDTGIEPVTKVGATFFARVRSGALEPLDATGLPEGELVLVRATPARIVPGNVALRRIVARGGPGSLPGDFAEQHDHYARGAARK